MKKRIFAIIGVIAVLLAFLTVSVSAMPASDEVYDSFIEWDISEDSKELARYEGEEKTVYHRLNIGQNRYSLENNLYYFWEEIETDYSYYSIISSARYSDIVYLEDIYSGEIIPYANGDASEIIDFVSGEYAFASLFLGDSLALTDKDFVDKLDALSSDPLSISVTELRDADIVEVKTYDSSFTLAHVHGAIYTVGDTPYYVNYDALGNSYFDNSGYFSYNKGVVELYPIKGELATEYDDLLSSMGYYNPVIKYEILEVNTGDEELFEFTKETAAVFLISIIAIFGIVIPAIPFTISLIGLVKKKARHVFVTYVSFAASAIWLALGFVMLVLVITCL